MKQVSLYRCQWAFFFFFFLIGDVIEYWSSTEVTQYILTKSQTVWMPALSMTTKKIKNVLTSGM